MFSSIKAANVNNKNLILAIDEMFKEISVKHSIGTRVAGCVAT